MSYWDSSAVVKLYTRESDSSVFEQFAANASAPPVTSRLAVYEIQTTLWRKEAEGTLSPGAARLSYQRLIRDMADGHIQVVEFSDAVEQEFQSVLTRCFQNVPPLPVRTLDAIHLAFAVVTGATQLVATDKRLRDAALVLGLKVFP